MAFLFPVIATQIFLFRKALSESLSKNKNTSQGSPSRRLIKNYTRGLEINVKSLVAVIATEPSLRYWTKICNCNLKNASRVSCEKLARWRSHITTHNSVVLVCDTSVCMMSVRITHNHIFFIKRDPSSHAGAVKSLHAVMISLKEFFFSFFPTL